MSDVCCHISTLQDACLRSPLGLLPDNNGGPQGMQALAGALPTLTRLETLILCGN